jgi:Domain of unknown function (DUF5753)
MGRTKCNWMVAVRDRPVRPGPRHGRVVIIKPPAGAVPVSPWTLCHARHGLGGVIGMARRPNIMIQVIPQRVDVHEGLNGSFVIADFADAPSIVYLETALTGFTIERPEHVAMVRLGYETLRAEALSPAASLPLMEEVAKSWT